MTDWYRRAEWNEEIAADFEARLARARPSSRAQYLSLQGYALLGANSEAAETLLQRAVSLEDEGELPRACCYLALARVAQGNVDGAIDAYDIAIDAERQNSRHRSTAGVDRAFLIAVHGRRDLYWTALDQLAMAEGDEWSLAGLEALAAEAIIRSETGDNQRAQLRASEALEQFPPDADDAQWAGISFPALKSRLEAIAG
jgi:hypothetical protein